MVSPGNAPRRTAESEKSAGSFSRQLSVATELPLTLVAAVVVGGLIGYGVDRLLHSQPLGLLVFGALGFFAGVREILRRVGKSNRGSGPTST